MSTKKGMLKALGCSLYFLSFTFRRKNDTMIYNATRVDLRREEKP